MRACLAVVEVIVVGNIMSQKQDIILCFDCPYCGYPYKIAGMDLMDKRVKCGSCESKVQVRSHMATVSFRKRVLEDNKN